jgi:hypothetical protein
LVEPALVVARARRVVAAEVVDADLPRGEALAVRAARKQEGAQVVLALLARVAVFVRLAAVVDDAEACGAVLIASAIFICQAAIVALARPKDARLAVGLDAVRVHLAGVISFARAARTPLVLTAFIIVGTFIS